MGFLFMAADVNGAMTKGMTFFLRAIAIQRGIDLHSDKSGIERVRGDNEHQPITLCQPIIHPLYEISPVNFYQIDPHLDPSRLEILDEWLDQGIIGMAMANEDTRWVHRTDPPSSMTPYGVLTRDVDDQGRSQEQDSKFPCTLLALLVLEDITILAYGRRFVTTTARAEMIPARASYRVRRFWLWRAFRGVVGCFPKLQLARDISDRGWRRGLLFRHGAAQAFDREYTVATCCCQ